ncbi:MAG TPA: hypothetical protein GX517_07340 [Alicyclobacillus sp.]|nr:hypothetical protein [Alicyclobacillus sp.]
MRDGIPMVRVVFPSGVTIEGPMLKVLTRIDVLKSVESAAWQRNGLRIA